MKLMATAGPIILIEDDREDVEIFTEALREINLKNELVHFGTSLEAIEYLRTTTECPFLIFCDMNLPMMSGIEFRKKIEEDPLLRKKSIPFIFYSTSADPIIIDETYAEMIVQGFFLKEISFSGIRETLTTITDYWLLCRLPQC